MIEPSRDLRQLAQAAQEWLEEGWCAPYADRVLANKSPEMRERERGKLMPKRSAADGYYIWLKYIAWLERVVVDLHQQLPLLAVEAEGLLVLRAARNEFLRSHPACPGCGDLNESTALNCRSCFGELKL